MVNNSRQERIAEVVDALKKVAGGDYTTQIPLSSNNDDIDSVVVGFNKMVEDLKKTSQQLANVNTQLRQEIMIRRQAEAALQQANTKLEAQVAVRTAKLAEANRKLKRAQSIARIGSWDWDLVNQTIEWSDELFRITEIPVQRVTPELITNRLQSEDQIVFKTALRRALRENKPVDFEFRWRRSDGSFCYVLGEGEVSRDEHGKPARMSGTVQDISPRKQIEIQLRESEERFRKLSEAGDEGIAIHKEGTIIDVNPAMAHMFGYQATEMIGTTPNQYTTPEYVDRIFEYINSSYDKPYEIVAVRKDGSTFPCQVRGKAFWYQEHELRVATFVDITELKRAEEARRESEGRYLLLAQNVSDIIWTMDRNLRFTYISPSVEKMRGYTVEEAMAQTLEDVITPSSIKVVSHSFKAIMERYGSGKSAPDAMRLELEQLNKDGTATWVEVSINPLFNELGEFTGALGITRDISERRKVEEERRQLEAQILQAQKLESLGLLAGGIAHDFNNLLAGILGNASVALEELQPDSLPFECIKDIETAARRAADLARQMLAYSGKGRFIIRPVDLNSLVEEMGQLLSVSISKKAVLKYDLANEIPPIRGDATQIRQIIMNLITNASDAVGDRSGIIAISTGTMDCDSQYLASTYLDDQLPPGLYSYIEVADTGKGMDKETMQRIFDPFFSTKFTGRGLGLAATLGIVRGHKGAIKVTSTDGKGTTLKVLFPAVETSLPLVKETARAVSKWKASGTVLLVDDEETVRTMGRRMLKHLGFDVITANDGREALQIFRRESESIVCVLLDLTMPHMDGEQCFRELRNIRRDICVLLSSGYPEQELIRQFGGQGPAGFIQKPYILETLMEKMKEALKTKIH